MLSGPGQSSCAVSCRSTFSLVYAPTTILNSLRVPPPRPSPSLHIQHPLRFLFRSRRHRHRRRPSSSPLPPPLNLKSMVEAMVKDDNRKTLYTRLRIWEFPDKYVIEPIDGTSESYLAINRGDGSISSINELPSDPSPKCRTVYGVAGMLKLIAEPQPGTSGSLKGKGARITKCPNNPKRPMGRGEADPRFLWNDYMLEVLIDSEVDRYLLPLVQGSYQNFRAEVGKDTVDVTLIARRCTRRTGTRMWRRGADADGYVANFVETEQIVQSKGFTASFVQVRGSIPLLWEQIVDLTYKPKFRIVKSEDAPRVVERHFLDLRKRYGSVLAVDLVNQTVIAKENNFKQPGERYRSFDPDRQERFIRRWVEALSDARVTHEIRSIWITYWFQADNSLGQKLATRLNVRPSM
ncbi:Phosphoinositide phosphatase SAC7 [Acorus calamus]|uniref:Phosphoinositide phosphatase SAC7 n=1 Tax=Acorus calamus TaxID=4465 RepID=A0AAV9FMF2_ACOCL|nr:Phosphoinositide phosphatase SAC7 [Acorus calamus]